MAASASVIVYSLKSFSEGARGWRRGSQGVNRLAYRVPEGQGVGLQGLMGSRIWPTGSQGVKGYASNRWSQGVKG